MSPRKLSSMHKKIEKALSEAIHQVVDDHKISGIPLAVWKNGKVTNISAKKIKLS